MVINMFKSVNLFLPNVSVSWWYKNVELQKTPQWRRLQWNDGVGLIYKYNSLHFCSHDFTCW